MQASASKTESTKSKMLDKAKKREQDKLDTRRSDEKLKKKLRDWGIIKAQREQKSLAKIDSKMMMSYTGKQFTSRNPKPSYRTSTYFRSKLKKKQQKDTIGREMGCLFRCFRNISS